MELTPPVQRFFDADNSGDEEQMLGAFAADATVTDEGKTHSGHAEIAAWWRASKSAYQHRACPMQIDTDGDERIVRAEVTGNFPGSPAMLGFAFQVAEDRIARLEIGA